MTTQAIDIEQKTNLQDLTIEEKQSLYKQVYNSENRFQKEFGKDWFEFECDYIEKFRDKVSQLLVDKDITEEIVPLEKLHDHIDDEMRAYDFDHGINKISTLFYENDEEFNEIYMNFISEVLAKEVFDFPFLFQATPTLRLHCPNAENSNHYPRYHTDIGYGHPPETINLWLPLTYPVGTSLHRFRIMSLEKSKETLEKFDHDFGQLIESAINNEDFTNECDKVSHPVETKFGDVLAFDARCLHTSQSMLEHTRVSIDVRIIAVEDFENMAIRYQGAGRSKILFEPNGCYHNLRSDKL